MTTFVVIWVEECVGHSTFGCVSKLKRRFSQRVCERPTWTFVLSFSPSWPLSPPVAQKGVAAALFTFTNINVYWQLYDAVSHRTHPDQQAAPTIGWRTGPWTTTGTLHSGPSITFNCYGSYKPCNRLEFQSTITRRWSRHKILHLTLQQPIVAIVLSTTTWPRK